MDCNIKIGRKQFIRSKGKNEFWLQDIICSSPEKLGLGSDIELVRKEKKQHTGGRLDILLENPSNNTRYEVEVMLGETDPSHIIRTIEYWDNERRIYQQHQHYAVLIAESFSRRYFNVIQLLSKTIPIIAIQADLIEVGNELVLHFTKIMDMYLPPEEESIVTSVDKWEKKSKWVVEIADLFVELFKKQYPNESVTLTYTQSYVRLNLNGKPQYFLHKRASPCVCVEIYVKDEEKKDQIDKLFSPYSIDPVYNNNKAYTFTIDKNFIEKNNKLFLDIQEIRDRGTSSDDD